MSEFTLDSAKPLPLTKKQKADIKALAEMPDSKIDYSDIPALSDESWKNAIASPFHKMSYLRLRCANRSYAGYYLARGPINTPFSSSRMLEIAY